MDEQNTAPNPIPVSQTPKVPQNPTLIALIILVVILLIATGFLAYQNMQLQKQVTKSQVSTYNSPVPSGTDETANWKTYISQFGYQFSYPSNWQLNPDQNAPASSIFAPDAKGFDGKFIIGRSAGGSSLCKQNELYQIEHNPQMVRSQITLDNHQAVQLVGKSTLADNIAHDRITVLVTNGDTCFSLDGISSNSTIEQNIFNQIRSTFKFTDQSQTDTSNWKIFTNQKYSYSVKYPSDFSVSSDLFDSNPNNSSSVILKKAVDDYGKPTFYIQVNDQSVSGEFSYRNQPFKTLEELATIHHQDILSQKETFIKEIKGMQKTTFLGQPAYTYTEESKAFIGITTSNLGVQGPFTYIVFQYKSSFYLIGYYEESIFNQILSTFAFTK